MRKIGIVFALLLCAVVSVTSRRMMQSVPQHQAEAMPAGHPMPKTISPAFRQCRTYWPGSPAICRQLLSTMTM